MTEPRDAIATWTPSPFITCWDEPDPDWRDTVNAYNRDAANDPEYATDEEEDD